MHRRRKKIRFQQPSKTVEIVGRRSQDYVSDYSFAATKIAMKNKDLSIMLSTVKNELIKQASFQLEDYLKVYLDSKTNLFTATYKL